MRRFIHNHFLPFTEQFENWNILLGWGVFLNALVTYSLTVEPTVSFWDCGEYIATSAKLGVPHPPGAPFFQMIGAFFALFAHDKTQVALMVNYVSCLASAFTILFLFWTITNLLKKLMENKYKSNLTAIMILGSALIGALTFTYSDSFWFNAVETEVYALASLVMAVLIWLGLKWTDSLDEKRGNKWLLLIAFIVGLTFGIQFMGFLTIPSLALLYFFKKYKAVSLKKFVVFNLVAVGILMLIFKFSLTNVLKLFWGLELFFVNQLGLPFYTGTVIAMLLLLFLVYAILKYAYNKKRFTLHTATLCLLFLLIGFTPELVLPLRANVNVGINEYSPSNARSLLAYYNREWYPSTDSPFYGAYYSDKFAASSGSRDDKPKYEKNKQLGKYEIVNHYKGALHLQSPKHKGFLPRMWSGENAENYMRYFGALRFHIKSKYVSNAELREVVVNIKNKLENGEIDTAQYIEFLKKFQEYIDVEPPSLWDNIKYMLQYQFNYMYFRYFMWNFAGKNNDIQGRYDGNGEWLSGFNFVDGPRLGSQKNLPKDITDNKGRNTYFFLPLLIGIVGILFQISKDRNQFWVFLVFFLFTGLAIQFYTNPPIFQPRERDYSLVGSFYAYAIWTGIGVYGIFHFFQKYVQLKKLSVLGLLLVLGGVPFLMAFQNWDDHDRSNRYTARASAKAYLDSTQSNSGAILFTIGDNDNFPLWYLQEIEEYRTDVRVIVTSYFATDWFIDQMKRKSYQSDPIPSQLTHEQYRYGTRDYIYHQPLTDKRWDIKDFMNWIASDNPATKRRDLLEKNGMDTSRFSENELNTVFYPTNKIRVPVDKMKVLENGLVNKKDANLIVDYIDIDLPDVLYKNRMMMLDVLANNNWDRPIYFSGGSFDDGEYIWMKEYLQLDGLAYKLVPIHTPYKGGIDMGRVNTERSLEIVKKWDWGNSGSDKIYHDPQTRRQFGVTFRICLARLMEQLIQENKIEKAEEIIDIAMKNIPFEHYGYFMFVEPFLEGYYKVGQTNNARKLFNKLKTVYQERLDYYSSIPLENQYEQIENIISDIQAFKSNVDMLTDNDTEFAPSEMENFNAYLNKFPHFLGD